MKTHSSADHRNISGWAIKNPVATAVLFAVLTFAGTYALLGTGALGFYFQTAAFQAGALSASLPAMTLLEPVVAVGVGIAILQEHVRADGLEWFLLGVAGVVMVVATVALSLSSARASAP